MSNLIRVQRKRTKGYRLPENTKSVCRPGKWGNPFKIGDSLSSISSVVLSHIRFTEQENEYGKIKDAEMSVKLFKIWINFTYPGGVLKSQAQCFLKGKNLACFCGLDQPCHADYLLKIANE